MSEEGEIPKHLRESVSSAEAYMADARREFQLQQKAWQLRIPRESLTNATVHRYIGVLHDFETGIEQLEWPDRGALVTPPPDSARYDRESQLGALYNSGRSILQDGLGGRWLDLADLKHWLDFLARRYGGRVGYIDPPHPVSEPPPARGPLWSGRSSSEPDPFEHRPWPAPWTDRGSWWTDIERPGHERHDREYESALKAEAARQDLPTDPHRIDPVTRVLLGRLVTARQLAAATTDLSGLPEAPGLTPTAPERLMRAAPLARLAVGVLEEEFHPGRLSPSRVTGELNEVGRMYGLKIQ